MKRLKKLAVVLLSIITLGTSVPVISSCEGFSDVLGDIMAGTNAQTLGTPQKLRIEDGCLVWNPVEFATKYTVSIDGKEYIAEDCKYSLVNVRDGEHIFKVKANGDGVLYTTSGYSAEYKETLVSGAVAKDYAYQYFENLSENESYVGGGFNVVEGSTFASKAIRQGFSIFNREELKKQRLLKVDAPNSEIKDIRASDMKTFIENWNTRFNVGVEWGGKRVGGSVEIDAKYSSDSKEIQSQYFHCIDIYNQKFYIVMQSDMNTYRNILSEGFKKDLYSDMEPAVLFNRYGTHFITSAVMGGRINAHYTYTSKQKEELREFSIKVSGEIKSKIDVNVGGQFKFTQEAEERGIDIEDSLTIMGGGEFGIKTAADIGPNYLAWAKSLDTEAEIMGLKDTTSLIPIWELIDAAKDSEEQYTWDYSYTNENGEEIHLKNEGTRAQQLQAYFEAYGLDSYNTLMRNSGLPEIVMPERIDNIKVNNKDAVHGEYEVFAGVGNDISFKVGPDNAVGYTKTASLSSSTEYAKINDENGRLSLEVSADCPHNTTFNIVVSAGSIRKTIKVRVIKRHTVKFVTGLGENIYYTDIEEDNLIDRPEDLLWNGHILEGWYTDPDCVEGTKFDFGKDRIKGDLTLYANWVSEEEIEEAKTVQVTFMENVPHEDAMSPSSTMGTFLYDEKVPQNLPKNTFKIDGWIFKGWATEEDGCVVYKDQAKLDNIYDHIEENETTLNLYAVWGVDVNTIGQIVKDRKNGTVVADTDKENSYTVYTSIDNTPWNPPAGKTIIDWSKETDTNLLNHKNRVLGEKNKYNQIDISYRATGATEVIFVGDPTKTYTNFRMYICWYGEGKELTLRFVNFNFRTNGSTAIGAWGNDTKLIVDVIGTCSITTTFYNDGCEYGGFIIGRENSDFEDLTFIGDGTMTITAGNGENGVDDGYDGCVAIVADKLTVNMTGTLVVNGGNGGNGANGKKGEDQTDQPGDKAWADNADGVQGYAGGKGRDGWNGGNGGNSIDVDKIEVLSGTCILNGGKSGAGGNGGKGGKGGNGGNTSCWSGGGHWGGKGGTGGKGGDGGNAGTVGNNDAYQEELSCYVAQGATLEIKAGTLGKKGKGGEGGDGGAGGIGASSIFNYNTNFGDTGDKGEPGKDGSGAD